MTASLGMFLTFISIFPRFFFSLHSFSLPVFCSFFLLFMMHYLSPLTLLGILRRAHMHRNTSPLSSRLLVFADSLCNSLSDAFSPTHCPLSTLIAVFLCINRLFLVVADQQHLQPLWQLSGMMTWIVPLLLFMISSISSLSWLKSCSHGGLMYVVK